MFIDAYEDGIHVSPSASASAPASTVKKPWPPTIDDNSVVGGKNSGGAYTDDDDAYADDDDPNSIVVIDHLESEGVGDYTDAYDALDDELSFPREAIIQVIGK